MTPATERFNIGDIIRYDNGVSALFRYTGTHNCGRLYGDHVLGGVGSGADRIFFDLRPASAEDIEFCRQRRPEWFAGIATNTQTYATFGSSPVEQPLTEEQAEDLSRRAT